MEPCGEPQEERWVEHAQDTLDGIFLPGRVYNLRPSFVPSGVIPGVADTFDDRIGTTFPIFPETLQLAPELAVNEVCRELVNTAGFSFPAPETFRVYKNREEYEALMRDVERGQMVLDHIHPEEALDPEKYWIPREVFGSLINKAELARWVPDVYLAERRVASRERAERETRDLFSDGQGCVIKTTGAVPTGGGFGVRHVRQAHRFAEELTALPGEGDVVVERFMRAERSYCLNLVLPERQDGTVPVPEYLGVSLQLFKDGLLFKGGLVPNRCLPNRETIRAGAAVAWRAARGGYRGMLGVDVLETEAHGPIVVDVNPRLNYSTPAIVLARTLRRRLGAHLLVGGITLRIPRGKEQRMAEVARDLIRREAAFPIRWFIYPPGEEWGAKTVMLIPAENEQKLNRVQQEIVQMGFAE